MLNPATSLVLYSNHFSFSKTARTPPRAPPARRRCPRAATSSRRRRRRRGGAAPLPTSQGCSARVAVLLLGACSVCRALWLARCGCARVVFRSGRRVINRAALFVVRHRRREFGMAARAIIDGVLCFYRKLFTASTRVLINSCDAINRLKNEKLRLWSDASVVPGRGWLAE